MAEESHPDDGVVDLSLLDDESLIQYVEKLSQQAEAHRENKEYTRDEYFKDKEIKQAAQDELFYKERGYKSTIFSKCIIYINGYTNPDRLTLHEFVVSNGGKFLHHLSAKGNATHIVASRLPLKKRLEFANYKVVAPAWIVDSVEAGKLLPWQEYSLLNDVQYGQIKLDLVNLKAKKNSTAIIDCNHPDFINNFFENSRLHHLSTWKADLRANFLQEFLSDENIAIPTPKDNVMIFHVDFDCFFATVAALSSRDVKVDLVKDAILVCHGSKNSDIASCNYVARNLGIKNGMWVASAEKLCPEGMKLICLPYDYKLFEAKSRIFYETLKNMNLFQMILPISIDEAICVLVNPDPGTDYNKICESVRSEIYDATCGCTVSIGCSNSLVMARLCLKTSKPDGYGVDNANSTNLEENFLFWSKLTIQDLPGIGKAIVRKLQDYYHLKSDCTLFDLGLKSNLETLKSCLGYKTGTKVYLALQGKDDEESVKILYQPKEVFQRKSLSVEINWGIRFEFIEQVDVFIERATSYVVNKLKELNKFTPQVTLKIMKRAKDSPIEPIKYMGMGLCDAFSRTTKFSSPTDDVGWIATELKNVYRSLTCQPRDLRGVSIQFNKLIDPNDSSKQHTLSFKKQIPINIFDNVPKLLKSNIKDELDKRSISLVSPKSRSPSSRRLVERKYSPTKDEEEFMEVLPTQIRNEVKHDLSIAKKIKHSKLEELQHQHDERIKVEHNSKSHFQGSNSIFNSISFQGEKSFKKISQLVDRWVHETLRDNGPHKRDVKLFEKYLLKLSNSNRLFLVLSLTKLVANILNNSPAVIEKISNNTADVGFSDWERILLTMMIPILNKNKHTFQTFRDLDIEFDI